jgi:hypothetical protein
MHGFRLRASVVRAEVERYRQQHLGQRGKRKKPAQCS